MLAACASFDASAVPAEASVEGGSLVDAAPNADGADLDAPLPTKRCRGAFQPPRTIDVDPGFFKQLRSVRGTANGVYLVSWDTSPDDNMGTAKLDATGLHLDPDPNRFAALNVSTDESTPTGPATLGYILFASDRAVPAVADGGKGPSRLFVSKATDNFAFATNVDVASVAAADPIRNPYQVDARVYFDVNGVVRAGDFTKASNSIAVVTDVGGLETGSNPVVTSDRLEIFYKVGVGVGLQSRSNQADSFATGGPIKLLASQGDYPTWVSDDACQLFVIHQGLDHKELLILDRDP